MKKIDFGLRTLTPIWSGDVNRDSAMVRETGLLGSLRWWYEGIVRGMEGVACDPTDENACNYKPWDPRPPEEQLCPACLLFGCTGWQRRFRLEATALAPIPLFFEASEGVYQAAGNWLWRMFGGQETGGSKTGRGRELHFQFGVKTQWADKSKLTITPLRPLADSWGSLACQLNFLLDTIARWGALGAKSQNGFGQISLIGLDQMQVNEGRRELKSRIVRLTSQNKNLNKKNAFNLSRLFSRTYSVGAGGPYAANLRLIGTAEGFAYRNHFIPCAFDLRYKNRARNPFTGQGKDFGMRPWFKTKYGAEITKLLFGNSHALHDSDRSAGRIGVSHLYREQPTGPFHVKVWGHVPETISIGPDGVAREIDSYLREVFPDLALVAEYKMQEVLKS